MIWYIILTSFLLYGEGSAFGGSDKLAGSDKCQVPSPTSHGSWYCPKSTSVCHLECEPGYAASSRTSSTCKYGIWSSPFPSSLSCLPAVALITGGLLAANTVEVYGPNIHSRLPDLPDTRVGHTLDYVDSFILACGGSTMKGPPVDPPPPSLSSCLRMKDDLTWTFHSSMSYTRDIGASAVNLGQLNILGGADFPTKRDTITPADSKTWTQHDIGKTKYTCGVKISAEEFLATGGAYSATAATAYNVVTGATRTLKDLSQARSGHGCAFVSSSRMVGVVVAGGFPAGGAMWTQDVSRATTSHTEFYNVKKAEWRRVGDLNEARRGLKLVFVQGVLYAMGGFNGTDYVKTVEQFNFATESWSYAKDMFEARAFPGVVAIPDVMLQMQNAARINHLPSAIGTIIFSIILTKL